MLQTDSPTSTLLATPRSQIQDLPPQQLAPSSSPSPPPSSTVGRRHKSRKNNSSKSRHHRKSVDIKPATPASDQVTIAPLQLSADQAMDWKQQQGAVQPVRVDVQAPKGGKRFTLPKLFTISPSKQFDPYSPPPPRVERELTDGTRGCSEDTTDYPRTKSLSKARRTPAVAEAVAASRADEAEVVVVVAPSNGTTESHPDGLQVVPPSPSSDVPSHTSSQALPADDRSPLSSPPSRQQRPAHQESSGSQVPESLYPRGPPPAMKSPTSRSRFGPVFRERASTDPIVGGTSRRDRRRWSKFWKALAKMIGLKASVPPSGVVSPGKGKGKAKAKSPTDSEVGSVVETLPAVDVDEVEDNAVGLSLDVRPTPPSRSGSNSPYMERPAAALEPHNVPLPGGESSLSLVSFDNPDDGAEQERQETSRHSHSFSSPINASSSSFTTESPLSVPSFLPDRSATTITLPTTVDPSSTCLDLSIEEEDALPREEESDKSAGDDTLTEDDTTPTASPCPPLAIDPSASTYTLQLAQSTAIPDDSDSDIDECPPTPHLPSASHPNQTAPQLTTSEPEVSAPSPPVATKPDLKRSASTTNVAPPPPAAKRTGGGGPSKFLFVKHSRWRGNSTLGHELGIRMFEEQYPTIETSLFDARVERTWLPPPPATHDEDGDSIIDVVDDQYSDFDDEPIGGWKEYFEDDDYYHDEDGEGDESTELGHGHGHGHRHGHGHGHGKQGAEHSEDLADLAFCAASSSGSLVSSAEQHGHH